MNFMWIISDALPPFDEACGRTVQYAGSLWRPSSIHGVGKKRRLSAVYMVTGAKQLNMLL
jgi:hypothetical protein